MNHEQRSKKCPECRSVLLDPVDYDHIELDVCVQCGVLWFDAGELAEIIRSHDPDAVPPRPVAEWIADATGVSTRVCPTCHLPLGLHQLSQANPVPVEICQECAGGWLPKGTLARVQAGHQLPEARAIIDAERTWGTWLFQFLAGLPVEFDLRPRKTPVVTFALIAINAILFHAMWLWPVFELDSITRLFLNPSQLGELRWVASLLSSQFLHANLIHLIGNMYFLWILGDNVEDLLGRVKFLAFYLAAGVVAGVVYSILIFPLDLPMIGASGAVSGVLGFYAVLFRRSRLTFMLVFLQFKLVAPIYVAIWACINLGAMWAEVPGVAWEAHLGGLAFGLILGIAFYGTLLRHRPLLRLLNGAVRPISPTAVQAGSGSGKPP